MVETPERADEETGQRHSSIQFCPSLLIILFVLFPSLSLSVSCALSRSERSETKRAKVRFVRAEISPFLLTTLLEKGKGVVSSFRLLHKHSLSPLNTNTT